MLDEAAVPELAGAMESIATHRQYFEGQGCMPCRAGGGTHTHTRSPFHNHTHRNPKGRVVQRRAANPTSTNAIRPGAAEFTCPAIHSLRGRKRAHVHRMCVCVCVGVCAREMEKELKGQKKES